jgi:hypothetical protein
MVIRSEMNVGTLAADEYGDQPLFANTDMAKRWHLLGFIVQRPSEGPEPIFVETQRGDLQKDTYYSRPRPSEQRAAVFVEDQAGDSKKHALAPKRNFPRGGGIILPKPEDGNHPIKTVKSLQEHLQTAIAVELSTIPLYLFAMYSIKTPAAYVNDPRYYDLTTAAIRGASVFQSVFIITLMYFGA